MNPRVCLGVGRVVGDRTKPGALDFELLAQCPFPHTRLGSQIVAGEGFLNGAGSEQEFSGAGPLKQRDHQSPSGAGGGGTGVGVGSTAAAGLSKGSPVPQVWASPLPPG